MANDKGRLRWRCRRGMKELDLVMLGYLERHYDQASAAEREAFEALIEIQDPQLYAYVTGKDAPPEGPMRHVVECLRRAAHP